MHPSTITCVSPIQGPVIVGQGLDLAPEAVHHETSQQQEEGEAKAESDDEAVAKAGSGAVDGFPA